MGGNLQQIERKSLLENSAKMRRKQFSQLEDILCCVRIQHQAVSIILGYLNNKSLRMMADFLEIAKEWFLGLGKQYGVNPIIFGSIYVGAIPFFTVSIAWLISNYKKDESIVVPALCATGCFISAYVYLIIAGKNVPWWVYGIVVLMVLYGAWSTYTNVRKKMNKIDKGVIDNE